MALVPMERPTEALERSPAAVDASVGELVSRLAQESRDLVAVEVRRLRLEARRQSRFLTNAAQAGAVAVACLTLASVALTTGVFLGLGAWWHSYVGAAFVTGGLLALAGLAALLVAQRYIRRLRSGSGSGDHRASDGAGLEHAQHAGT